MGKVFSDVTSQYDHQDCKSQRDEGYGEAQPANQKFLYVVGRQVEPHDQPDGCECRREYDKFGITRCVHDIKLQDIRFKPSLC